MAEKNEFIAMSSSKSIFDTLWLNIHLATMESDNSYGIIKQGAIATIKDKIAWVGKESDLPKSAITKARKIYKGNYAWVTPGLIDCHTHLIFGGNRINDFIRKKDGISYNEIISKGGGIYDTVNKTRQASYADLIGSAKKRIKQLFNDGVTTIEIKSGYGLDLETEVKILRIATELKKTLNLRIMRTFLGAHVFPKEYKGKEKEYIDFLCSVMLPLIKKEGLADFIDAFCDTIAFLPEQVEKLFIFSGKYGFKVKIHAEQFKNLKCAKLAVKFKALSADHLEYIDEDSISELKKADSVAVLLPGASYYLQEKKHPAISLLRKYAVPIAIATDLNPGTSPINSLLTILNFACIIFNLTPEEALRGVTKNAAKALGILSSVGTLKIGKKADFVVWNISHPAELSYGINMPIEKTVICNGKIQYDIISPE